MSLKKGGEIVLQDKAKEEIADWYRHYSDSVFKYILMMVRDHQQAEDLTHDTFIKAYRYYPSFEGRAKARTWLFSIARNITVDYIRKQKPVQLFKDIFLTKKDTEPLPEDTVGIKENARELYNALGNLKHSYREVIILRK